MLWNSFKPTMVSDLWANAATGSASRDINRLKKERQADAIGDAEQAQNMAEKNTAAMEQKSAIDREKRMAQIEGEPGDKYITRLQNQAMDPNSYGKKYRAQFGEQEQQGAAPGAEVEDEMEKRRRRRMSMASAFSE
jgi:hypothetical protein